MKIFLASERGFCAGVKNAVELVLKEAKKEKNKIFVLHELVHNAAVVRNLQEHGVRIVNTPEEVPPGSTLIFSAHGISSAAEGAARALPLHVMDATCPLVKHVHHLAAQYDAEGFRVLLAGKKGHREVEGILGRIPSGSGELIESAEQAECFEPEGINYVLLSQTTYLVEEFERIREILRKKIPSLEVKNTICRATSARQQQTRSLAAHCGAVLVVGSPESSNSRRLCETASACGAKSYLVNAGTPIPPELAGFSGNLGIISGASASEEEVEQLLRKLLTLPGAEFAGEFC